MSPLKPHPRRPPSATISTKPPGTVRIIAGRWRGRKIPVPPVPGVRPSPDRIRETLFNWLQPVIAGSRCLDLFAGTGILALEALSRGAREVVAVDDDLSVADHLQHAKESVGADTLIIHHADALRWLNLTPEPFDIVFLDPPFRQDLVKPCLEKLITNGWLTPAARIYVETERELALSLPDNCKILKTGNAGQVRAWLLGLS